MANQGKLPHFDDIVLHILPLLKNGITPEKQSILGILQDVAIRCEGDCWKLRDIGQQDFSLS